MATEKRSRCGCLRSLGEAANEWHQTVFEKSRPRSQIQTRVLHDENCSLLLTCDGRFSQERGVTSAFFQHFPSTENLADASN